MIHIPHHVSVNSKILLLLGLRQMLGLSTSEELLVNTINEEKEHIREALFDDITYVETPAGTFYMLTEKGTEQASTRLFRRLQKDF